MDRNKFSLKSRIVSFKFAFQGLRSLIKNEHNSRIHAVAAISVILLGFFLRISFSEWCFLTIIIGFVFITELLNSSIESLADIICHEKNEQIRKAKDYAAASVLISAISAIITGGLIFIPKIYSLIK